MANKLAEAFVEIGLRDNTPTALQRVRQNLQAAADNAKFQIELEGLKDVASAERELTGLNNTLKTVWSQLDALSKQKSDVLRNMGFDDKTVSKYAAGKGMPTFFGKMPRQDAAAIQFIDQQYDHLAKVHRQYEDQRVMVTNRSAALRMRAEQDAAEFTERQIFQEFMADDRMSDRRATKRKMGIGGRVGGRGGGGRGMAALEVARGLEDFAAVFPTMGLAGGLRAASNNISQMATVIHPAAGAVTGLTIAAITLAPSLYKMATAAKEPVEVMKTLRESIRGVQQAAEAGFAFDESFRDVMKVKDTAGAGKRVEAGGETLRKLEFDRQQKMNELMEFGRRHSRGGAGGEVKLTEKDAEFVSSAKLEVENLNRRIEGEHALIAAMRARIPVLDEIAYREGVATKAWERQFHLRSQRKEETAVGRDLNLDLRGRMNTAQNDRSSRESAMRSRPQVAAVIAQMEREIRTESKNAIGGEAQRAVRINAMRRAQERIGEIDKTEAVERQIQESQRGRQMKARGRAEKQVDAIGEIFSSINPRLGAQADILKDAANQKSQIKDLFPPDQARQIGGLIDKSTAVKLRDAGKPEGKFSGIADFGRSFQEAVSSKENRYMINIDENTKKTVDTLKGIHGALTKVLENTSSGFAD